MTALLWCLHISAVFQTAFVILWSASPWWREWIGRALMTKSAALAIILDVAVVTHYFPGYPYREQVATALWVLVTAGIVFQFFALAFEMFVRHRPIRGTEAHLPGGSDATHR